MNHYIALFREPDGRKNSQHTAEEIKQHRENWATWWKTWSSSGNLTGGSSLTLDGCLIKGDGQEITNDIHKVDTEIVGGFVLLKADSMKHASEIISSCPIYEFEGYAEVREYQQT